MNNPADYYDESTNIYDFSRWCADHNLDTLAVFNVEQTPALSVAAKMNNHNHDEGAYQRWLSDNKPEMDYKYSTRPVPFALFALLFVLGMLATFAPVVALATL